MYYLVNVDHNGTAADNTRVTVNGFKNCCTSSAVDGLMMICCGMTVKRIGRLGARVRKMKALSTKNETVTMIGSRQNLTNFVY